MKKLFFLLPALLLFFACEEASTSNNTATNPVATPSSDNQTVPNPADKKPEAPAVDDEELSGSPLDFSAFNQQIKAAQAASEEWTSSPLLVLN
jgi:hypothetical protein